MGIWRGEWTGQLNWRSHRGSDKGRTKRVRMGMVRMKMAVALLDCHEDDDDDAAASAVGRRRRREEEELEPLPESDLRPL